MLQQKEGSPSHSPQLISTDWCQFSLKGMIPDVKKGFRKVNKRINLQYRGYGHHNWSNEVTVHLDGEQIGRMDVLPTSLMSPDCIVWYTNNKMQYSKGWTDKLKYVWKEMNLSFTHVGRIDIAVDAPENKQFDFIKKLTSGKLRLVGGSKFTVQYTNDAKVDYFRFGSRSSDKFMRAYYKRQEIERSNKYYMEEVWEANGFNLDEGQEVTRFEIVLKRKELKKYYDVWEKYGELDETNLELLEDPSYLAALFNTGKKSFFEFVSRRSLARTGNVSRCKRIKILDLSGITSYLLEKIKSKCTTAVYSAKISAKFLFMLCCKTCDPRYMAEIEEILHNFNLQRWFNAKRERFYNEFKLRYESQHFEFLTNYTSQPEFVQGKLYNLQNYQL